MIETDKINKNIKVVIAISLSLLCLLSFLGDIFLCVFCFSFSIKLLEDALYPLSWKTTVFSTLFTYPPLLLI